MAVEFNDYRIEVKAALNDTTIAWLHKWAHEVASQAKGNCQLDGDAGSQLRGNYKPDVDEGAGEAKVGSTLEAAYWEEFGTGEHAKGSRPGRQGWWVYVEGQARQNGGKTYGTKAEADETVAYLRGKGLKAFATNGRDPNYTLEKAFKVTEPKARADLETMLKKGME